MRKMSAKLLHSLSGENPDLQKQIGCMSGIFQIFDRHHFLSGRRSHHHNRNHNHKRQQLPPPAGIMTYEYLYKICQVTSILKPIMYFTKATQFPRGYNCVKLIPVIYIHTYIHIDGYMFHDFNS